MGFRVAHGEPFHGSAVYHPAEYGIAWEHQEPRESSVDLGPRVFESALEIGTLTLGVDTSDGRVGFPEGYHPNHAWERALVDVPPAQQGALYWDDPISLVRGGALRLSSVEDVTSVFDESTGWIHIELRCEVPGPEVECDMIEFCDGVIAGLLGSRLMDVWIRLQFAPFE